LNTSLSRSLLILEAVIESEQPRGISELARELDMDKSAVQRTFQALTSAGYLEKVVGSAKYRATLRVWELGAKVISQHEAARLVHPILRYAAQTSGLTAYLAWASPPSIVYLDKVEGEKGRTNSSQPGRRVPMHRTAAGRAILAFLNDADTELVLHQPGATADSQEAPTAIRDDLALIRERLYAITRSGSFAQVNSIAAPVWSAHQQAPVGSIVLTSDAATLPEEDFDRIGGLAVSIAEQATRALGGSYPSTHADNP
jgi:DNA-binding IclR family transcriptional regulator